LVAFNAHILWFSRTLAEVGLEAGLHPRCPWARHNFASCNGGPLGESRIHVGAAFIPGWARARRSFEQGLGQIVI
jgi:hypothetical protein